MGALGSRLLLCDNHQFGRPLHHIFYFMYFCKVYKRKNTKTKTKSKILILELFIFSLISVVTNARLSHSFYLLQNWIIVTKLMESIDYFPSGQMYQNTKHITTNV